MAGAHAPSWWSLRLARDGLSVVGVAVVLFLLPKLEPAVGPAGYDAYAYWHVDPLAPYHFDRTVVQLGAFRYSPAAAQACVLFQWLPWDAFLALWLGIQVGVLAWLGREWTIALLAFPCVALNLYFGNIEVLLAAAIVAGVRWPAAWAFVLLTKVSPGVGLLWFVVRREWRNLAVALGATGVLAATSFVIAPDAWLEWPRALQSVSDQPYGVGLFPLRFALAVPLVAWGARTSRPWTLVVGGTLALAWLDVKTLALLVGLGAYLPRTRPATPAEPVR